MAINLSDLEAETRCPVCLGTLLHKTYFTMLLPPLSLSMRCCALLLQCVSDKQCYAAAGVIKNARLVSGCMHRFCAECIEKWLRVCRHVHPQHPLDSIAVYLSQMPSSKPTNAFFICHKVILWHTYRSHSSHTCSNMPHASVHPCNLHTIPHSTHVLILYLSLITL